MKRDFKALIEARFGRGKNNPDSFLFNLLLLFFFHAINPTGLNLNNNMNNVKSLKHIN